MNRRRQVSRRIADTGDNAGNPLDGLVNLFDIGIVLSVAFLVAALSAIDLSPEVLSGEQETKATRTAPADTITRSRDEQERTITIDPKERVVGRGKRLGEVYKLDDGRTILVKPGGSTP